ncbi:MAG: hypothetical protein J7M27_12640 [Candidatus Latescibacteria bacterium]|nr:hypothetical protein [Candidatus Latescibacterota bacterium]
MKPTFFPVNMLVEGYTDEVVLRRILEYVGLTCGTVYGKEGKGVLLKRLPSYNQAARFAPWLVTVDLDQDADCAPDFVRNVLPNPADGMHFRVAVRAIEAWLLADAERLAAFLRVRVSKIPAHPDAEPNPKRTLINLARQSRKRIIREDIVPREGSGGSVGPGYTGRFIEFVTATEHLWRPDVAMQRSDSLRRCVEALHTFCGSTRSASGNIERREWNGCGTK